MTAMKDMSGQRVGSWVVLAIAGKDPHGQFLWLCKCDCGTEKPVTGGRLRRGESVSCGCTKPAACAAANIRHGHSTRGHLSPEYRTWSNMIDRCERVANRQYADYGGRGITVCERWRADFAHFFEDMGLRPSLFHTIERVDNSRGYEPENCRWATRSEQNRNKRNTIWVTVGGQRIPLSDAARMLDVKYIVAYSRYVAAGKPTGEAGDVLRGAKIKALSEMAALMDYVD